MCSTVVATIIAVALAIVVYGGFGLFFKRARANELKRDPNDLGGLP
jgi:hypothetical protein